MYSNLNCYSTCDVCIQIDKYCRYMYYTLYLVDAQGSERERVSSLQIHHQYLAVQNHALSMRTGSWKVVLHLRHLRDCWEVADEEEEVVVVVVGEEEKVVVVMVVIEKRRRGRKKRRRKYIRRTCVPLHTL